MPNSFPPLPSLACFSASDVDANPTTDPSPTRQQRPNTPQEGTSRTSKRPDHETDSPTLLPTPHSHLASSPCHLSKPPYRPTMSAKSTLVERLTQDALPPDPDRRVVPYPHSTLPLAHSPEPKAKSEGRAKMTARTHERSEQQKARQAKEEPRQGRCEGRNAPLHALDRTPDDPRQPDCPRKIQGS